MSFHDGDFRTVNRGDTQLLGGILRHLAGSHLGMVERTDVRLDGLIKSFTLRELGEHLLHRRSGITFALLLRLGVGIAFLLLGLFITLAFILLDLLGIGIAFTLLRLFLVAFLLLGIIVTLALLRVEQILALGKGLVGRILEKSSDLLAEFVRIQHLRRLLHFWHLHRVEY